MNVDVSNLAELNRLAKKLAANLKGGEIVALNGNLGAGKTTFTKLLLKEAGIKNRVSSPTFALMVPYAKKAAAGARKTCTFYHMDLYRIHGYKDITALGVPELWGKKNNIFIIEWADKIKKHLPPKTIYINFKINKNNRIATLKNVPKDFKI